MNSTRFANIRKRAKKNCIDWGKINKEKYYGDWRFLIKHDDCSVYVVYEKDYLPEKYCNRDIIICRMEYNGNRKISKHKYNLPQNVLILEVKEQIEEFKKEVKNES